MIKIMVKQFRNFLIIGALATFSFRNTNAQEINKEVYVVRPYEPTLSDAAKYNFLPVTGDLESRPPRFDYSIKPVRLENSFEPEPIKAAKTVTTSLPKIYKTWLKIGLGNYTTPMAEFNISNLRSKDLSYGAYFYHKSSYGNIRLPNDHKVPAGYATNNINLYGKKFFTKATLSGNLRLDHHAFQYYGYNTALFTDPLPDMENDSIRQRTYLTGIDLGLGSNTTDRTQLNYKVSASVDYFADRQKYRETGIVVKAGVNKYFNSLLYGLDMTLDYSNLNGATDSLRNTIFRFNPWISKQADEWKFVLGFEAVADIAHITNYYFYPRVNLDITIVENVLVPFLGLSGELTKNSYRNISSENQWVNPGAFFKNSSNLIAYGGIKGSISSVVRFRADVSYTLFKNYHFFVNDTLLPLDNQFTAVYDDIDLITYHGQLAVQPAGKFEMTIDGKYFDYKTYDQQKPWHKPDFLIGVDASYAISPKFTAGADFTVTGNRWVWNSSSPDETDKLKPVADINLHMNYHYSKLFTVFADFYNIADRSYMLWNQYPSQRFNFLIGFSYKL
jgi:hypothetical protein